MTAVGSPFSRSRVIFAAMSALIGAGASFMRAAELAGAGSYKSRGKGEGRSRASNNTIARDKRAAVKAKNRMKHRRACK